MFKYINIMLHGHNILFPKNSYYGNNSPTQILIHFTSIGDRIQFCMKIRICDHSLAKLAKIIEHLYTNRA